MDEPRWADVATCLDIQAPWGNALLSGAKTIETREYVLPAMDCARPACCAFSWACCVRSLVLTTRLSFVCAMWSRYALPLMHVGEPLALLEDRGAGVPAMLLGTVSFGQPFRYETREQWAADTGQHKVPVDAGADSFGWVDGVVEKWGWPVVAVHRARYPVAAPPMVRTLRSLFKLQWQRRGRVVCRPDFRERLIAARETLDTKGDGEASLLVLADFDRTLSAYAAPQKAHVDATTADISGADAEIEVGEECHDVIFHHASLGDGFKRAVAPLLLAADADKEAQTPQEMAALLNASAGDDSHQISFDDWEAYATWWWNTAHAAMIDHGLSKQEISRAVSRARVAMRNGTRELVQGCAETATPLVVVSAGITDVIDALMVAHVGPELWPTAAERHVLARTAAHAADHSASMPPVVVHANQGIFSASGTARGTETAAANEMLVDFSPTPPIHWLNKILTTRPLATSLGFGNKVIVLLGDSVKDVTMVEGLAEQDVPPAVLKIGLLNTTVGDSPSEQLAEYMAVYDVVITGDGPLDFVITDVLGELWNWEQPIATHPDQGANLPNAAPRL